MSSYKQLLKILLIGFLVFFMVDTTLSSGLTQDVAPGGNRQDPTVTVYGQLGKNNWFVSEVTIIFEYNPEKEEIQYFLDGVWHVYYEPFYVQDDGTYQIPWLWIDSENQTHYVGPIEFKIDTTSPIVQLTKKSVSKTEDSFTATASDSISQVEYVEFYLDDELQETVNTAPYQYTWTGYEVQTVYAVAYDYAGLSEKSNTLTTPRAFFVNHYIMQRFFVLLRIMLFRL